MITLACLAAVLLAIGWMCTWDWGGDSQCSSLSATERKALMVLKGYAQ